MQPSEQRADIAMDPSLLARVLEPYKPHCRYLRSAVVSHAAGRSGRPRDRSLCRIEGEFTIDASCYIEDTGHLNAVEVNICYNQMLYALFAQGVVTGFIPPLHHLDLDAWLRRQLPDVLIRELSMSFRRVIDRRRFFGWMTFDAAAVRRNLMVFPSRCRFWDAQGGLAEGRIKVVVVDDDRSQAEKGREGAS